MGFSHERLDVYQRTIEFIAWSQTLLEEISGGGSARTQLERAATSIALNLAEGNVKSSRRDRRRYWETSLGSAVECAAVLDVLVARRLRSSAQVAGGKDVLEAIASMMVRLIQGLGD